MKIAHVTEAWHGGISTYVNTVLDALSSNENITSQTLIYSQNQTQHDFDPEFYSRNNIALHPYTSTRNPLKISKTAKTVQKIINELKPDIVHLHSSFPGVYGRLFASKDRSYKIIYCAHGWSFVQETGHLKKTIYTSVEQYLSRRTDTLLHISEHEYREAKKKNIKAKINTALPSGVRDVNYRDSDLINTTEEIPLKIGFIGRLDYKKGFDIAADIFSNVLDRSLYSLYVIGDADREENKAEIQAPNIHTIGWVNHKHIDDYIRDFDVVFIPSRQEGFGLVAVEAMRNGKPVIASKQGGLPELIQEGHNGHLFDIESYRTQIPAIFSKLDRNKLSVMGQNARAVYENKYTIKRFVDGMIECYLATLKS